VTHTDTVAWDKNRFLNSIERELGELPVIFAGKDTSGDELKRDILSRCGSQWDLTITSESFLKYFKINDNNLKILGSVRQEVAMFQAMNQSFLEQLATGEWSLQDRVNMVFQFQAYMLEEIVQAEKRVSHTNSFTFDGSTSAIESGHIANLKNQLRAVLYDVRMMALGHQNDAGVSYLRKCPHCGEIWAKIEGCDGETTCGNPVGELDERFHIMANFTFEFDGRRLSITKGASRPVGDTHQKVNGSGAGCGRRIAWANMMPVAVPPEIVEKKNAVTSLGFLERARPSRKRRSLEHSLERRGS